MDGASASEPSAPKKDKLVFVRWDTSFDNVTSDLTINAVYADDINENGKADADENKFTIRFETNGNGIFTGETSFTGLLEGLKVYDFIELPEYEANPGYTFIGWDRDLPEDDAVITDSFVYTAIFKDITKPEVIVSDIVDGQFNPEKFTFNAKDPNGIVSLSYTIRPKGETKSVQSGYIKYQDILDDLTKTYSINELPDGEYELRISIRDVAENSNHGSVINFIVDNTNPKLEDVLINKNITNENSIEISGKIFDENIRYTSIRIFNSLNESVLQKTVSGNYDGLIENLDISTFDDDTYRVRLKVYDLAGNTEQINKTLVIDRTAPSKPTITARNDYQAGTWTNETVILNFTSTDFLTSSENLRYESTTSPVLHPDSWKAIENPAEFKVNVYNNVYVRAIDEAGNISDYSDFFQVKVDKNKPNAPVIDTNGYISGTWTREDVKLNASGSESPYANESKVKYQFRYNEENSWQDFDSVWFNTNSNVKVTFRAIDEAGNISDDSETIQVLIDKSAPSKPTITARNDYQAGTWTNETVILNFTSIDNVTSSENLRYEYNTSTSETGWRSITNPRTFNTDIYNNVYVRAIDETGNKSEISKFFQVKVDKTNPNKPVITNSSEGLLTNENITISWNATDVAVGTAISGISHYEYSFDEEKWEVTDEQNMTFAESTVKEMFIRAVDNAGNKSSTSSTTINLNKKLITYSTSYSKENPSRVVVATVKFNFPVTKSLNFDDLWLPSKNCLKNSFNGYCDEWTKLYASNIEEEALFKSEDGQNPTPLIKINNIDRELNKATFMKTVSADRKSVLVTLTADEEVIVESNGWTKVNEDGTVWEKNYTSNTIEFIKYKDLAGNYRLLDTVTINELSWFPWFNTNETDIITDQPLITIEENTTEIEQEVNSDVIIPKDEDLILE